VLVYHARWVLPVSRAPIEGGAVAVEHGRIAWVGLAADAPADAMHVDLGDAFLLPGLVNAHTHLELTAMRGYLEDLPFREWILRLTNARAHVLATGDLLASARLGIAEGLEAGITTYADTSFGSGAFDAMREMGVRGVSYQEVFGPHPQQAAAAVQELRERIERLAPRATELVRLGVSPHAPYTVSDELFRAVARAAAQHRWPLATHVAESREETQFVAHAAGPFADGWRQRGLAVQPRAPSPLALLRNTGVLDVQPLLIHCVHVAEGDIESLPVGCTVAHCPASNAKFAHGVAPLLRFIERGIPVGLGSDSVASNNHMSLLDEARSAVQLSRATVRSASLDAPTALTLATLGGARALGIDTEVGSLEPGKWADLAAFRADAVRDIAVFQPEAALLFGAAGRRAIMVAVAGRELVRDGGLVANLEHDFAVLRAAADRLRQYSLEGSAGPRLDFGVAPASGENDFTATESHS
jgi:cytosine/adenosine deaminase-related metal-dependent hydrolase